MTGTGQRGRAQSRPPRVRARRGAFGRGFRQRSPLVLVVAALLAAAALFAFQDVLLRGDFTAISQGRFLRITNDDYVHISYRLAQLKKHPPAKPTRPEYPVRGNRKK